MMYAEQRNDWLSPSPSSIRTVGMLASHPFAKNAKEWGTLILSVI
jgi:hypothetical protein